MENITLNLNSAKICGSVGIWAIDTFSVVESVEFDPAFWGTDAVEDMDTVDCCSCSSHHLQTAEAQCSRAHLNDRRPPRQSAGFDVVHVRHSAHYSSNTLHVPILGSSCAAIAPTLDVSFITFDARKTEAMKLAGNTDKFRMTLDKCDCREIPRPPE